MRDSVRVVCCAYEKLAKIAIRAKQYSPIDTYTSINTFADSFAHPILSSNSSSINKSIPFIHLFTHPSIIHQSIYTPYTFPSIRISNDLLIHPSNDSFIYTFNSFIRPLIHQFINPSFFINSSIYIDLYNSVYDWENRVNCILDICISNILVPETKLRF